MSRDPWLIQPAPPSADMAEGAAQAGAPQRRVAAISLPGLAIERWQRLRAARGAAPVPDDVPLALIVQGPHGAQVHAVSTGAALAGVQAGAPLVLMRAVCPDLRIAAGDPSGDRAALARLGEWAAGWGEAPAVDGPDGLSAEVTDSAGRFGGEALMASGITGALGRAGLGARVAVGPSRAGAWALARFAPAAGGAAAGPVIGDHDALLALPVEALRLSPRPLMLLRRLGLRRIADLAALPRESLARRFAGAAPADNPLARLDALTGHAPDLPEGAAMFRAAVAPDPPLTDPGPWLAALLADLCAQMAAAGQGCLALRLDLHRADGPRHSLVLRLASPSRDPQILLAQFGTRPAAVALRFDLDMMVLCTLSVAPMPHTPPHPVPDRPILQPPPPACSPIPPGLGRDVGARLVAPDDPMLPCLDGSPPPAAFTPHLRVVPPPSERPVHLLIPPERIEPVGDTCAELPMQFIWRGRLLRLTAPPTPDSLDANCSHPETPLAPRQYFKAEDYTGQRLWMFRQTGGSGSGCPAPWFLHGIFQPA